MKTQILVADDSRIVRAALKSILENRNPAWEISEAENGHETLEKIQTLQPILVLLDLNLPDMPGHQAARQIRQLSPETKIIFCSFSDSAQLAIMAQQAGADGYVIKDSSPNDISNTIKSILNEQ